MDVGQNARGSSFFFQMALLFSFSFLFLFGFQEKLKGKEKGKISKCLLQDVI
jgi:hypothetical protein